jgi:putative tricarboxylic transport membrane protein
LTDAQLKDRSEKSEGLVDVKKAEFAVALVIGVVGLIAALKGVELGPGWGEGGPEPGFLPFSLGVIIMIASVLILIQASRATGGTIFDQKEEIVELVRVGLPILLAGLFVETIGFYLMVAVYSAGFIIWYGRYRWYAVIPAVLLFAYGLFQILENFFRVFMPKSMFYSDSFPY